ncbi:hypothetical protein R5R35_004943 [Gryllus longicercus]|uniref:Solute carrier family 66 member 2 n=1 Tax=Gryllus longicercus TaxID=2509291 RepID=A0AAN9Z6T5_9ORTH
MDNLWEELSDISILKLVKWGAIMAMVFGGVVPFIPQYREIKRTDDAEGFSLFVCLTLLIANTLRILFWFGKRYELPLLIQSIIMNITMLIMVNLCVTVKNRNQIIRGRERVFTDPGTRDPRPSHSKQLRADHNFLDFDTKYFWAWTDFISYVDFLIVFTIVTSFFMYLFVEISFFVELIGFLALFAEALLGAPQLLRNYQHKSTEGMSVAMVMMWTMGDTFKTCYFLLREAPLQFWVCGALQVCIDLFILLQVQLYRLSPGVRRTRNMPD